MRSAPEDGASANTEAPPCSPWQTCLQRLVGSPCPCWHSTMPSLGQTSRPSNLRSQPRNHMALKRSRTHCPGSRNLSHAPCSTAPSLPQTILPASSRSHLHNCRGPPGVVVQSADHRCDDGRNTTAAWMSPSLGTVPPHNCMDRQVQVPL